MWLAMLVLAQQCSVYSVESNTNPAWWVGCLQHVACGTFNSPRSGIRRVGKVLSQNRTMKIPTPRFDDLPSAAPAAMDYYIVDIGANCEASEYSQIEKERQDTLKSQVYAPSGLRYRIYCCSSGDSGVGALFRA